MKRTLHRLLSVVLTALAITALLSTAALAADGDATETRYLQIAYQQVRYEQEDGEGTTIWYAVIPAKYKMHYAYAEDKLFGYEKPSENAARHGATIAVNTQFLGFPIIDGKRLVDGDDVTGYDFYITQNEDAAVRHDVFNVYATDDPTDEQAGISFRDIDLGFAYDGNYVNYTSSYSGVSNNTIYMALYYQIVKDGQVTDQPNAVLTVRHPRTWLAYDSEGNQYVATAAGRNKPLSDGTSLSQLGLTYLEMVDATKQFMTKDIQTMYNLDGGGSCSFVYKGEKLSPNYDGNPAVERKNYGVFYWKAEQRKVTTHHYLENTTEPFSPDVTVTLYEGDTYTTVPAQYDACFYTVIEPDNVSDVLSGNTEVTYFYSLKESPHSWDDPDWTWNGYTAAEAVFTCADCDAEHTAAATITSQTAAPTAGADGSTVYTATVNIGDSTYTDTRTETISALGYTVTVVNGTASHQRAHAGEAVTITADNRNGYTFKGWRAKGAAAFADSEAPVTTFTMPAGNVIVTATYTGGDSGSVTPTQYTLTYITNGGSAISASRHNSGTKVDLTAAPVREGYTFTGWYSEAALTTQITSITMNGSKTVFAGWKENEKPVDPKPLDQFTDVPADAWYKMAVDYATEKGLMQGVADDLFGPEVTTSRAMIVTILYRLEGEPAVSGLSPFFDVPADGGQWYTNAILWAGRNGIVEGYIEGPHKVFGPDKPITREQLSVILYRYVQMKGGGFTGAWYFPLDFADAADVSDWADEAMHWCVMNGIFEGDENGKLCPQGEATRAEVAAILMRFIENVK